MLSPPCSLLCCRRGKEEVCCVLSLCVFLSHVDLLVSGHAVIEMATTFTPVTPSAALVLFPTDPEDLERGNDNGTPIPTSDNDDNSLGYTGRVFSFPNTNCSCLLKRLPLHQSSTTCVKLSPHCCFPLTTSTTSGPHFPDVILQPGGHIAKVNSWGKRNVTLSAACFLVV